MEWEVGMRWVRERVRYEGGIEMIYLRE